MGFRGVGWRTKAVSALLPALFLASCATEPRPSPRGEANAHYKVGKPYKINGRWYRPAVDPDYNKVGTASWYGRDFHGRQTANGEIYNMNDMTAAHPTLPMPSYVEVTNLNNGRKLTVRVNDRGPFAKNRIIDLSRAAARKLGFERAGTAKVRVRYIGPAALPGEKRGRIYAKAQPVPVEPTAVPEMEYSSDLAIAQRRPYVETAPTRSRARPAPGPTATLNRAQLDALIASVDDGRPPRMPLVMDPIDNGRPVRTYEPIVSDSAPAPVPGSWQRAPSIEHGNFLVLVAQLTDLSAIPIVRADLIDEGPFRIARVEATPDSGPAQYRVHLGPFFSENDAQESLVRVLKAGYAAAEIVPAAP